MLFMKAHVTSRVHLKPDPSLILCGARCLFVSLSGCAVINRCQVDTTERIVTVECLSWRVKTMTPSPQQWTGVALLEHGAKRPQ